MAFRKRLRQQAELVSGSRSAPVQRGPVSAPLCLVASACPTRQERLAECATVAGWRPVICASLDGALSTVRRTLFRLAIVDLTESWSEEVTGFRALAEHLRQQTELLLVLCGNADVASEEIWARQLGAWMYLPGMVGEEEMQMICRAAVESANKLKHGAPIIAVS